MKLEWPARPEGHTPDKTGRPDEPWLTREAIGFLEGVLLPSRSRVLEFGSGSSTLWLARRSLRVDSLEHDVGWFEQVGKAIAASGMSNIRLCRGSPDNAFHEYVELGKSVAKERGPFDLVLVDGRERVRCAQAVHGTVEPGGYLVLDNAERPRYADVRKILSGWEVRETSNGIWRTDIFRKPGASKR